MKPVLQTRFGGSDAPENEQGDCMRAAIASAFEIELAEVPDFAGQINNGSWFLTLERWLANRNLALYVVPASSGHPMGFHLAATKSTTLAKESDGHVVVIGDGNVVHDPNPRSSRIGEREEYWAFVCLDPSKQPLQEG